MVHITDYRFGRVKVGNTIYHRDVLVSGDDVLCPWVRREGHALYPEDLKWVVERSPEVFIIGTGAFGRLRVPQETKEWLAARGIELVALPTAQAITEYNRRPAARVACGLHLTC